MMASVAAQFRLHHPLMTPDASRAVSIFGTSIAGKTLARLRRLDGMVNVEMFAVRVTEVSQMYRERNGKQLLSTSQSSRPDRAASASKKPPRGRRSPSD